jgi:hypothetical protein
MSHAIPKASNDVVSKTKVGPIFPRAGLIGESKKRTLSAAGRAAIINAAKKRWAKVRKQAKKAGG